MAAAITLEADDIEIGDGFVLWPDEVGTLISVLQSKGYQVIGPMARDGAIVYDEIDGLNDLPIGISDVQKPGEYRLIDGPEGALFHYGVGPVSWKRFLYPPEQKLFSAKRTETGFSVVEDTTASKPMAFLGVHGCDLRAMGIQARVFDNGDYCDPGYKQRYEQTFMIAVGCSKACNSCFCASMADAGPELDENYDLCLTEILNGGSHRLLLEVGSERGKEIAAMLKLTEAGDDDWGAALCSSDESAASENSIMPSNIAEVLACSLESDHWEDIAKRCLNCANCTMVCPTCFCTTVEDVTDLSGDHAERWRKWDSCFTGDFSYIHGGAIRRDGSSRYRQWMTHKLLNWHEQFGTSGCVGCGRCVTWCPVGIDIVAEANKFAELNRSK